MQCAVKLGNNNFIGSNSLIGHETIFGDHNFLAGGTTIGGLCTIKNTSFFGLHSTIVHSITIEDESFIGAASLITKNTEKFGRYLGVPAKKIDEHKENGIQLQD